MQDAAASPSTVNRQILLGLEARLCPPRDSYYLQGWQPAAGAERSTKWHNHMDAESDVLLSHLVSQVQARVPGAQQKIYPISHLRLGPQTASREFEDVYHRLPNFHPIHEAQDEAFTTGKMGDAVDYALTAATLEVCFAHPRRGVMTEVSRRGRRWRGRRGRRWRGPRWRGRWQRGRRGRRRRGRRW